MTSSPPHSCPVTSATSASAAIPSAPLPSLMCYGIYSAPSLASSPRATSPNGGPSSPPSEPYAASSSLPACSLLGVWVHDNPNQGNFFFVMLGFLSLIAYRVISQEVGPSGFDGDPLLWAPVFKIAAKSGGSMAFFLHGSENNSDYLYSGFVNSIHPQCSLLRLEVEPRPSRRSCNLLHRLESAIRRRHSDSDLPSCNSSVSPSSPAVPFSCLK